MEFLHSFLRCHLAGKPVKASPYVGSFLKLLPSKLSFTFADNKKIIIIITIKSFSTLLAFDSTDYSGLSSEHFCSLVLIPTFVQ